MSETQTETTELVIAAQAGELAQEQVQSQSQAIAFVQTPENVELLKKSLADSNTVLTDSELGIFLYQAQKTGLDPLARQIYVMKREQGGVSFMTSIDGQRLVAQRTREYEGQTPPEWCGPDGKWRGVWLGSGDPSAARIGVYRKGMREPVYGVATWKSYNQGRGTWRKMGDVMLAKCAEALALRKAFPQELSGLYTPEEMNVDDAPEPPRTRTTKDALAEAGRVLVEKGFSREEALLIMCGIADVDDPVQLIGNTLRPVLEIVNREDADNLSLYLPGDPDAAESEDEQPPEAQVEQPGATEVDDSPTPPKPVSKPARTLDVQTIKTHLRGLGFHTDEAIATALRDDYGVADPSGLTTADAERVLSLLRAKNSLKRGEPKQQEKLA